MSGARGSTGKNWNTKNILVLQYHILCDIIIIIKQNICSIVGGEEEKRRRDEKITKTDHN